jgi:putative flippase GtrA
MKRYMPAPGPCTTPLLTRWLRFNLIGAAGMIVQLTALALLNRLLPGRYLVDSAAALELTLLHNFLWHTHYTWRDRRDALPHHQRLLRLHLSNGVVSLGGNLGLMALLVRKGHLPLVLANAVAILCCSLANFWLSHHWTFPSVPWHSEDASHAR